LTRNFANAVSTTLSGAITNVQTTITVASASGFPTSYPFDAHIEAEGSNTDELVSITSLSSDTTFNVTRASEPYAGSSSASAHGSGANVRLVGPTAGALAEFGSPLTVTDGTTSVADVTKVTEVGATVSAGGAGEAIVTVTATVPTLADVLTVGNDVGSTQIMGAAGYVDITGSPIPGIVIRGATGTGADPGEFLVLYAGNDSHSGQPAGIVFAPGDGSGGHGKVQIATDNSGGNAADVLTADGAGNATWQPGVTADEKAALDAAPTALTALNPVASIADLPGPAPAPATTVTGPDSFGAPAVVGTDTAFARSDHDHGLPSAPAVPSAASTVSGPPAFGASAVVGTGAAFARNDHIHGLPAAPAVTVSWISIAKWGLP
jgi:hypothetical protein